MTYERRSEAERPSDTGAAEWTCTEQSRQRRQWIVRRLKATQHLFGARVVASNARTGRRERRRSRHSESRFATETPRILGVSREFVFRLYGCKPLPGLYRLWEDGEASPTRPLGGRS